MKETNGKVASLQDNRKPEQLITADQVAALISISPKSIYRWASEGRLPSFREGRVIRFLASDVEAFIKSRIGAGARGMD